MPTDDSPSQTTQRLLADLIRFPSISSRSNVDISDHVAGLLQRLHFTVERSTYVDAKGVTKCNLIACRSPASPGIVKKTVAFENAPPAPTRSGLAGSHESPTGTSRWTGLAYFCHTDVVRADRWGGPGGDPFQPTIDGNRMYGRGACDMKGSLAAFLAAAMRIDPDSQTHPLWIVCTADEEVGFEGARHLVNQSDMYRSVVDADPVCVIGEPTRLRVVHAHKGILAMRIHSRGKAAHSSKLDGLNANIAMVPMLQKLLEAEQRCRTDTSLRDPLFDPPTLTMNFGVSDSMRTVNIVPDHSTAWLSLRTMPGVNESELVRDIQDTAMSLGLEIQPLAGGDPMLTPATDPAVSEMCRLAQPFIGENTPQSECYATDGCMLGQLTRRIVCGPGDIAQAHTIDEFIELDELDRGVMFYRNVIERFCCQGDSPG